MAERSQRKLAVILHADVVGSTALARSNETLAHERIQNVFQLFSKTIDSYGGTAHELRGDALVAEFDRASDAIAASLAFQEENQKLNSSIVDDVQPFLRIGIAMGEVVIADNTVTGDGVVLAQRLEQLAESGGVCIQDAAYKTVPKRLPFEYEFLGERELKGFDEAERVFAVTLNTGVSVPAPERRRDTRVAKFGWRTIAAAVAIVIVGVGLAWWQPWQPEFTPASIEKMAFPLPEKPSIAVLPFTNLSNHPQGEVLADGVTETITATLGQVPGLFVISRNSTFTYKGQATRVQNVSQKLGVRYVLEGSVQRSENKVRITAQLIDALSGRHLWADRYDRNLQDIFALQDEIALKVLVALQVNVTEGEQANARSYPTENLEAYLLYVRAMAVFRGFGKNGMINTRKLVDQSLAIDPEYASALILYAWTYVIDARFRFSRPREISIRKAQQLMEKAESLEKRLSDGLRAELLMARGFIDLIEGKHEKAVVFGSKAVALAPNNAFLVAVNGLILFFVRQYDNSIENLQRAMRLSPGFPSWYAAHLSTAYVFKGDHSRAIAALEESGKRAENKLMSAAHHLRYAFAYADQGKIQKAKQEIERVKALASYLTIQFFRNIMHFELEADWERFASTMRKAGLPE